MTEQIAIQREWIVKIWHEIMPIFKCHWNEMPHRDEPFELDTDLYEALEMVDQARLYTVREAGKLIGYAAYLIAPDLWRKGYFNARCHSIYLLPLARKGRTGIRLIRFCEEDILKTVRVSRFTLHSHSDRKEGRLFEILGYELVHNEYEKVI